MKQRTMRRRLAVLIGVRLVVATVLLGSAVVVQLREPDATSVNPFFFLIGLTFVVSLAFIGSLRFVERFPWLTDVHFAIDALLVSAAVFLTGGVQSLFTILYMLPIVAASSMQSRRGGLQVAGFSTILLMGVVLAQYLHADGYFELPRRLSINTALPGMQIAQFTVALDAFGLFGVALLSGSLAERVRLGEAQLEQATEEIADLQAFNQYVLDNLISGLATADADNMLLTFNRSAMLITARSGALPIGDPAAAVLQLRWHSPRTSRRTRPGAQHAHRLHLSASRRRDDGYRPERGPRCPTDRARLHLYLPGRHGREAVRNKTRGYSSSLAAVGEMAAGIAHEIRNPLASMSGSMQMLKEELPLSTDQAQLMDIVLKESERLNQTIKSFLAYARPQLVSLQKLDLRPLVHETAMLLRNSTDIEATHKIEVGQSETPVMIDADEAQIRQIIWNLATNGLRAMPDGGTLRLIAVHEVAGSELAVLRVEDEGVGIPPEEVEKIFQPFRGSFGKGTGLGLAIVHRIVTDYDGHIEVKPRPGRGTIFRVTFPMSADRRAERQAS